MMLGAVNAAAAAIVAEARVHLLLRSQPASATAAHREPQAV